MKSAIAYSAVAVFAAISCARIQTEESPLVPVRISLNAPVTRSGDDIFGADSRISGATVYVMDPSTSDSSVPGDVVDIFTFDTEGQTDFDIITSMGMKYFFIVLNGPAAGSPSSFSEVKAIQANMPQGRSDGPLMTGLSAKTNVNTAMQGIPITVTRQLFRVNITNITNSLPRNCNLTILYAYLSDYVSGYTLGNGNTPSISYGNSEGRNSAGVIDGVTVFADNPYTAISRAASIGSGAVCSDYEGIGMYAYPNPGTLRRTRVVLVASISGSICYYPIPLDPQNPNCSYDMDITIYNIGTQDPDTELAKGTVSVGLSVNDWNVNNYSSNL